AEHRPLTAPGAQVCTCCQVLVSKWRMMPWFSKLRVGQDWRVADKPPILSQGSTRPGSGSPRVLRRADESGAESNRLKPHHANARRTPVVRQGGACDSVSVIASDASTKTPGNQGFAHSDTSR